jgi:hypothetical protein
VLRKRAHRAAAVLRTRLARRRMRRTNRRLELQRARAAAPLAARSITGTPRPAKPGKATAAHRPAVSATGAAAPMAQRVKRTKGGRFNGSTAATKKTSASKSTASKAATPEARRAAAFQRALSTGDKRVARIDKRTDATDARLDREFRQS